MSSNHHQELVRRLAAADFNGVLVRQVSSTNQLARRIIAEFDEDGAAPPLAVIVGLEQTAGRGRQGRRWVSSPGAGSYVSVIERVALSSLAVLPMGIAVVVCETLNPLLGDRCRLKWPNDLMVAGRKLGGILVEAIPRPSDCADVIVGVGVNTAAVGAGRPPSATSIAEEAGHAVGWTDITWRLIEAVVGYFRELPESADMVTRYSGLSSHRRGDWLRCRIGEQQIEGSFAGFDRRGFLRLSIEGSERLISAGEVIE